MIKFISKAKKGDLRGTAILRLDFNTEDSWRLEAALPTIRLLMKSASSIVIVSHKGRPSVKVEGGIPRGEDLKKFSLKKDAVLLGKKLNKKVKFVPHFRFGEILEMLQGSKGKGDIYLLENIRFLGGESENDPDLGKLLASLGDYFVNDAFSVSHRKAASLVSVAELLPAYAGLVLEKEIEKLSTVIQKAKKPFVVIVGGGKAHDKLEVLENFRNKADLFLLGGAPANTLLSLHGLEVGNSLMDDDPRDLVILRKFLSNKKVIFPSDWLMTKGVILDIGPSTAETYAGILKKAKTILWAGPMGFIEKKKFSSGSLAVARAIAKNKKGYSITGGGETITFLKKHKLEKSFSFISTGGGAMLEFLSGKKLPGIEILKK